MPVWIEENTGLAGIALSFNVPEGYTLNSITKSSLLSKGSFSTDGNTCTWFAPTNMKSDGELMILNLTADENAQSGKVAVGVKNSDGNNFTDEHGASMLVDFAAGSVKVLSECELNGHTADKPVRENEKAATCKKEGSYDEVIYCSICKEEMSRETKSIPVGHHTYGEWKTVKEATTKEVGLKKRECSVCGNEETIEIPRIETRPTSSFNIILSKKAFIYNGKVQKPKVVVKTGNKVIPASSYVTTWSKGCKNVGTYKVTVKLKGNYSGSKTVAYQINPKGTSLVRIVSGKAKQNLINVTWKKQTKQTTGYQIQYGLKKNFKGAKSLKIKSVKKTGTTIKKLKRGKVYYVRIRTFKSVGKKVYVSGWSKIKKVKVK